VADLRTIPRASDLLLRAEDESSGGEEGTGTAALESLVKVFPMKNAASGSFLSAMVDATRALNTAYQQVVRVTSKWQGAI